MRTYTEAADLTYLADGSSKLVFGTLIGFDEGRPLVATSGSGGNGVVASALESVLQDLAGCPDDFIGSSVLVALVDDQPVLLGVMRTQVANFQKAAAKSIKHHRDVFIDGDRLVLDAKKEIVLRCGGSEIVMRKDGKVVIRGNNIISRSAGPNKIKGTSVNIN